MSRTFSLNAEVVHKVHTEYLRVLQELERSQSDYARYLTGAKPSVEHIRSLIEEAFWASLERIEGRHHCFSIAVCPKSSVDQPFLFEKARSFESEQLAKLSPAVEAEQTLIGVWPEGENLEIWGLCPAQMSEKSAASQMNEKHRPLVKVVDAGQILFQFHAFPHSAYARELISGTEAKSIEMNADVILNALWRAYPSDREDEFQRLLDFSAIAAYMRSHGHGGTLLIVPTDFENQQHAVDFSAYPVAPFERPKERPIAEFIGQLTAIDGATVVTVGLKVLGFGAKITLNDSSKEVIEHFIYKDQRPTNNDLSTFHWGMRHLSAFHFIAGLRDQRFIAIVASQDGGLTIFQWSIEEREEGGKGIVSVTRHAEYALP